MAGTPHIRFALAPLVAAMVAVALVVLLGSSGGGATAAAARGKCANENAGPHDASSQEMRDAVFCLISKERRKADVKPAARNGDLARVAGKHADVMLEENCLDHECHGEGSLKDRIERSGYPNPGARYGFGEVTGCALTPAGMVDAWMSSRVHRKRILGPKYRHVGIGVAKGQIVVNGCDDGGPRGVYAVIFGWRAR